MAGQTSNVPHVDLLRAHESTRPPACATADQSCQADGRATPTGSRAAGEEDNEWEGRELERRQTPRHVVTTAMAPNNPPDGATPVDKQASACLPAGRWSGPGASLRSAFPPADSPGSDHNRHYTPPAGCLAGFTLPATRPVATLPLCASKHGDAARERPTAKKTGRRCVHSKEAHQARSPECSAPPPAAARMQTRRGPAAAGGSSGPRGRTQSWPDLEVRSGVKGWDW